MNAPKLSFNPLPLSGVLFQALEAQDLAAVKQAVAWGADPRAKQGSALAYAASRGQEAIVGYLLAVMGPLEQAVGNRVLDAAAMNNHWAVVEVLLAHGAQMTEKARDQIKARAPSLLLDQLQPPLAPGEQDALLKDAVETRDLSRVVALVSRRSPDHCYNAPLRLALSYGSVALAEAVLPCADLAAVEEALWKAHNYTQLDLLACVVAPGVRVRFLEEMGTRNLPQATERARADRRATQLAAHPASPASVRPRRRS